MILHIFGFFSICAVFHRDSAVQIEANLIY